MHKDFAAALLSFSQDIFYVLLCFFREEYLNIGWYLLENESTIYKGLFLCQFIVDTLDKVYSGPYLVGQWL